MNFKYEPDRIYLENENGKMIAEVNFPEVAKNEVNICHTFVDSSLRGKGIADKITSELAEHLKKNNKKAHATCSYAVEWFGSHPEYDDIYLNKK